MHNIVKIKRNFSLKGSLSGANAMSRHFAFCCHACDKVCEMIVYDKLWDYMKERGVSQYRLNLLGLSHATLTRLKRNQPVSTESLDKLCNILDCRIEDIVTHVKNDVQNAQ